MHYALQTAISNPLLHKTKAFNSANVKVNVITKLVALLQQPHQPRKEGQEATKKEAT